MYYTASAPLPISHYAPFTTPWGIHSTTQSIDNQQKYSQYPKKYKKNTPHKWGIAHHTFARVLAAGEEHPQRLLRSRSACRPSLPLPFSLPISHYAPFTTPWGMHNTTQSIDNQQKYSQYPKKYKKNTLHKWGIAHHTFARVLAAGEVHPQRLLRSRSQFPIMPHLPLHAASTMPHNQLIINK